VAQNVEAHVAVEASTLLPHSEPVAKLSCGYPPKPKQGVRASRPNEYWHIDVTVIKLLDGTRTYLHAVIDNFSRRILAWKLVLRLEPQTTCQVLIEAAKNLPKDGDGATVVADSGGENVNHEVDDLFGLGQLRRVLAFGFLCSFRHLANARRNVCNVLIHS
jgi:transposase InsO family protein